MTYRRISPRRRKRPTTPPGGSALVLMLCVLAVLAVLAVLVAVIWYRSNGETSGEMILHTVKREAFVYDVVEHGQVESSENVEVRCEVKARGAGGTTILEVVDEGQFVEGPKMLTAGNWAVDLNLPWLVGCRAHPSLLLMVGDPLVVLDSSGLVISRDQQQIVCNKSKAAMIKARNAYDAAMIAKEEYLKGTFIQESEKIQIEQDLAEESLRRAREYALFSERLAAKGYVTALQLEGDRFAEEKARKELKLARIKLNVLREYTKKKKLKELDSDIVTNEANWMAEQSSYQLELDNLAEIEDQIGKCTIYAPAAGQVVHANRQSHRGTSEFIVEEGAIVREGQEIIRLPNPQKMQVKAKVNESRIERIAVGMTASIRLDAFPDLTLDGDVTKVNEYPEPSSWFSSQVKEYATLVKIIDPPEHVKIKPGLTAEVTIHVGYLDHAVQVPVQAIHEHGGAYYCVVSKDDKLELAEVQIGPSNDEFIVVEKGLEEDDQVVMNPRRHLDGLELPELPAADEPPARRPANGKKPRPDATGAPGGEPARGRPKDGASPSDRPSGGAASGGAATGGAATGGGPPGGGHGGGGQHPGGGGFDPAKVVGMMFSRMDKNKAGKLSKDEIPAEHRDRVLKADANKDGSVTRAEMTAAMKKRMQQGGNK